MGGASAPHTDVALTFVLLCSNPKIDYSHYLCLHFQIFLLHDLFLYHIFLLLHNSIDSYIYIIFIYVIYVIYTYIIYIFLMYILYENRGVVSVLVFPIS